MSIELKPCPFCGGGAEFSGVVPMPDGIRTIVGCAGCSARVYAPTTDRLRAARLWNRRAERTCRFVINDDNYWSCSACGYEPNWDIAISDNPPDWAFCPGCGAKAVDGDE